MRTYHPDHGDLTPLNFFCSCLSSYAYGLRPPMSYKKKFPFRFLSANVFMELIKKNNLQITITNFVSKLFLFRLQLFKNSIRNLITLRYMRN